MGARPNTGFVRWQMLAIICLGFFALTLNWFNAAAAFGDIGADFHLSLSDITLLSSLFFAGYGLAHIPGGLLSTKIGMKRTLVVGLVVQGIAGIMSGLSYHYTELAIFRVVAGIGGSIFIAVAFAAVIVWFKDHEMTLALGISGGGAFSGGAAFGLFIWVYLQNDVGWHAALWIAGIIELIIAALTAFFFDVPAGESRLGGVSFERKGLLQALMSRDLWIYGICLLGAYGGYFTVSQLFPTYAVAVKHLPVTEASLLAAVITLGGIPGAVLGGLVGDRTHRLREVIVGSLILSGIFLALVPSVSTGLMWIVGPISGFFVIFGFACWCTVSERVCHLKHEHVGTATGLMLTIAAVGGYFAPRIFGHLVTSHGYTYSWHVLAIAAVVFALVGVFARNPAHSQVGADAHPDDSVTPAPSVA